MICPINTCKMDNDDNNDVCIKCGAPLKELSNILNYHSFLYNIGLKAAKEKEYNKAKDYFTAAVLWSPNDNEARNALAYIFLLTNKYKEAKEHWTIVVESNPSDEIAIRGLKKIHDSQNHHKKMKSKTNSKSRKQKIKRHK